MPSRPRSVKIIKKIVKKKTYSVSALPKSEEMQGKSPDKTLAASRHQASTPDMNILQKYKYEVKTIKIDRSGTRSVLTSKSIKDQPKEVRDFSNSMKMLHSIKQNSKSQLRKYQRSR